MNKTTVFIFCSQYDDEFKLWCHRFSFIMVQQTKTVENTLPDNCCSDNALHQVPRRNVTRIPVLIPVNSIKNVNT